ncbi:MAG: thioesterase family protein [Sulfolobaceae archaeon]|nr:thioesterase family protein [Sulfolobaceae archaeon]
MLKEGLKLEEEYTVEKQHLASYVGSGEVDVLATPCLIAFIENACLKLVNKYIEGGLISVGYRVDVKHLAPAPLNSKVKVRVELVKIFRNHLVFKAEAYINDKKIAEGEHERVLVSKEEFLKRV